VSQSLVRTYTPEEREYARYLAQIDARKRRVAELQAELEALRLALGRFTAEYHARVGARFVELDRLRLAVAEYERRIALLRADRERDPRTVEEEVAAEFARRREEVHAEDEETRQYQRAYERDQQRPPLDADAEAEIKRLYRELAKRYHLDLARTDDERARRETVMQRVNAAFRDRDQPTLNALFREAEIADPTFETRPIGEKLVWAIREVARLDGLIADLEAELVAVRASDTHNLWQRQQAGERVIERLEADLAAEIATGQTRLAELVATYRDIVKDRGV